MDQNAYIMKLERELAETRNAAVTLIVGMAQAIAPTQEGRAELAAGFREAADASQDTSLTRLARIVAGVLERESACTYGSGEAQGTTGEQPVTK